MKRLPLAVALAGVLALGASQAAAFQIDPSASKGVRGDIVHAQYRGTQWVDPHCLKPSWSHRCRLHPRRSAAWPGLPRCYPVDGVCVYYTAPDWDQWRGWSWYGWN
jgi:hypothetical protein